MTEHALDHRRREAPAVVVDLDRQVGARRDDHGQRVVGPLDGPQVPDLEIADPLQERRVERIVLEHEDALEQRGAARHPAPLLDLHQRGVLVLAHLDLLLLEAPQPGDDRLAPSQAHPDRKRVQEEADHPLRPRQVGRTPRHHATEDHVVLAAVPPEEERPGPLHHGVERQLVPARQVAQRSGGGAGQPGPVQPVIVRAGRARGRAIHGERRGRCEARERPPPVRLRGFEVLPHEPRDVVAERRRILEARLLAPSERLVERHHLLQEDRQRPAVQEDVMVAPDELVHPVGKPRHRQALQGRA